MEARRWMDWRACACGQRRKLALAPIRLRGIDGARRPEAAPVRTSGRLKARLPQEHATRSIILEQVRVEAPSEGVHGNVCDRSNVWSHDLRKDRGRSRAL